MMWGASEGMGWWMVFGSVVWVVLLGIMVFLFTRTFEGPAHSHESPPPVSRPDTPLEIARRRYAAGEITEEEFRRLRDNLR